MHNTMSSYALNKKDHEAIVYTDADNHVIRLTSGDFATEADFMKWKAWSDEDYHAEEKGDHVHTNHAISMEELGDSAAASEGPEVVAVQNLDRQTREQLAAEKMESFRGIITEAQLRRLWMYYVVGLTQQQIAAAEGVGQRRISTSIAAAEKKIKKFSFLGQK